MDIIVAAAVAAAVDTTVAAAVDVVTGVSY